MSAKKTAWVVFLLVAAVIVIIYLARTMAPAAQTQADPEPTDTALGQHPAPAQVDKTNGFAQPYPDGPQAPEQHTPVQYPRQTIASPPTQRPDAEDPAAVAKAFLTVYNSRDSESDRSWRATTKPWLTPELAQKLPTVPNGALEGKAPTSVGKVQIKDNVKDWGVDTPLRWSHQVEVTLHTQDQGTYLLDYRVRAQLTDQGWRINAAPLDSWHRIELEK